MSEFRLLLYLDSVFNDHRTLSRIYVDQNIQCIGDLERYICNMFKIDIPIYLMADSHYLPPTADIRVLEKDESIILMKKDVKESAPKEEHVTKLSTQRQVEAEESNVNIRENEKKMYYPIKHIKESVKVPKKKANKQNEALNSSRKENKEVHSTQYNCSENFTPMHVVANSTAIQDPLEIKQRQFPKHKAPKPSESSSDSDENETSLKENFTPMHVVMQSKVIQDLLKIKHEEFLQQKCHESMDVVHENEMFKTANSQKEAKATQSKAFDKANDNDKRITSKCVNNLENQQLVANNDIKITHESDNKVNIVSDVKLDTILRKPLIIGNVIEQMDDEFEMSPPNLLNVPKRKRKRVRKRKKKSLSPCNSSSMPNDTYSDSSTFTTSAIKVRSSHIRFESEDDDHSEKPVDTCQSNSAVTMETAVEQESNECETKKPIYEGEVLTALCSDEIAETFPKMIAEKPKPHDLIAFKILIMSENYCPRISRYIGGKVLKYDAIEDVVSLEVLCGNDELKEPSGRFSLEEEEENKEENANFEFKWSDIKEVRLFYPKRKVM